MLLLLSACTPPDSGKPADSADSPDSAGTDSDSAPDSETTDSEDSDSTPRDADADGSPAGEDCDESDADVHPGAEERCNDVDDDCDGEVDEDAVDPSTFYEDVDGDGYGDDTSSSVACDAPAGFVEVGGDCDDGDPEVSPAAEERCTDEEDLDCDGIISATDADGDGVLACEDCDDGDPSSYPGAPERCDEADNDCDGESDEAAEDATTFYEDVDGDSWGDDSTALTQCTRPEGSVVIQGGDCDDADAAVHPSADESCEDVVDYNCDGSVGGVDADGDGFASCVDCNDLDPAMNPDAVEVCGGGDEDCDAEVDEAGASGESRWYADADGDGFGDGDTPTSACAAPEGYVVLDGDCDDADSEARPDAVESCGGGDEDCDGLVDDEDSGPVGAGTWFWDLDGDGWYGDSAVVACVAPEGAGAAVEDCDDEDPERHPGAAEVCDDADRDEDCDGAADDSDPDATGQGSWYLDGDGDGWAGSSTVSACDPGPSFHASSEDCDDAQPAVNPGAAELCDPAALDEDCDGLTNAADPDASLGVYYADADGDGFGDPSLTLEACEASAGWVPSGSDCDDADFAVHPGATELAGDEADQDCDGTELCLLDADDDGWLAGDGASTPSADLACDGAGEATSAAPGGDCDDGDATVSPAAVERCDGVDDDCDGTVDDGVGTMVYPDVDGDGWGDDAGAAVVCDEASGVLVGGDCDDSDPAASPEGVEVCGNGADDDCDGERADCALTGDLDAGDGLLLQGETAGGLFGFAAAIADFDGDGQEDLAVGAPGGERVATWYGPVLGSDRESGAAAGVEGPADVGSFGYTVRAGDLDGDKVSDLVVGATATAGAVWIGWGEPGRWSGDAEAESFADHAWIEVAGGEGFGGALSSGVDLDGDGADELVAGQSERSVTGPWDGAAWLFYGGARRSGALDDTDADASFQGAPGQRLGAAVELLPDLDGDGLGELLLGASGADGATGGTGGSYLFFGGGTRFSGGWTSADADFFFPGEQAAERLGASLTRLGDLSGDGHPDFAVAAPAWDAGSGADSGRIVIYAGGSGVFSVAELRGDEASMELGADLASLGDLDGDGYEELLAGAPGRSLGAGAAALFYGPLSGTLAFTDADASFAGATGAALGARLPRDGGDLDGDGDRDVAVGAAKDDTGAEDAGVFSLWSGLPGE